MLSKKNIYPNEYKSKHDKKHEHCKESNIKRFFNMLINKETKNNYSKRSSHKFVDKGNF